MRFERPHTDRLEDFGGGGPFAGAGERLEGGKGQSGRAKVKKRRVDKKIDEVKSLR